jgi:hypothetical protein
MKPKTGLHYTRHVSLPVCYACPIGLVLPLSPITYSPCFTSCYPLALLSGQLSPHFSLDIKRRPTQCCPHNSTQYLISAVLEVDTMAMVGTTVVLPTVAPLSAMILPMVSLSSAPARFLFDAVDDLSKKMYLNEKWSGSIKFRALPVYTPMDGLPLDKSSIEEVDICDYLGWSSLHPSVGRFYLDPKKYDKLPIDRESLTTNPHWMQLKDALQLAAHTSGSPVVCNGGRDNCTFQCKLCNHLYRPPLAKKDNAPRQDDCINMDKDGRRTEGRS